MKSSIQPRPTGVLSALSASLLLALATLASVACATHPPADPAPAPEAEATEAEASPEPAPAPAPKSMAKALEEVFAEGEPAAESGAAEAEEERELPAHLQPPRPPGEEWEVDDEGRRYFVGRIAKVEGAYRRVGDDQVRLRHGITVTLAGETEDEFLIKIFETQPIEVEDDTPTPEEVAEVERSYRSEIRSADQLTVRPFDTGLPGQGQWRNGFDVGDADGDGHLDIVHGPPRRGFSGPIILLGDGAGSWRIWSEASYPSLPYDYGDAEAADFDGDGHLDVALAVHLSGITVLRGDGEGDFEPWAEGLVLLPPGRAESDTFISRALASLDWDGDGRTDLVALSEGPRHPKATERESVEAPMGAVVYRNQGDGSWSEHARLSPDNELFGDAITVGDFDGDSRQDVAVGTNSMGRRQLVFLNRGETAEAVEVEALRPLAFVWAIEAADFDGDGRDDLAVATSARRVGEWWTSVDLLLSRETEDGGVRFERTVVEGGRETPDERVTALGVGDLDADGNVDLVTVSDSGLARVYVGDGRGGLVRAETTLGRAAEGCRGYHVRLADADGDGSDEVIVAVAGENCPGGGRLGAWKLTRP